MDDRAVSDNHEENDERPGAPDPPLGEWNADSPREPLTPGEWGTFIDAYTDLFLSIAWRFGLDHAAAEDVAADVVRVAYGCADLLRDPGERRRWLSRCAYNRSHEERRRRRRAPRPVDGDHLRDVAAQGTDPAARTEQQEFDFRLQMALAGLRSRDEYICRVCLAAADECPLARLSEDLGISRNGAVQARRRAFRRLLENLRWLAEQSGEEEFPWPR